MPRIQKLSASVVNKIAAGEVIERPASAVKELVENSLDAGATRIDVTIEQGGVDLVRVSDNGCGIAAEDMALAIASHATSKLQSADDLFRVRTLGFRGEALASIAEVSRCLLRSRPHDAAAGAELEVVGGESQPAAPAGCAPGTTIEVRNLFFNTPVRRKFLRSTSTEAGHVIEAFARLALAHPQVHFTLRHNARSLYDLPPAAAWDQRIAALHGEDLARALLWVESTSGATRLAGYVAHPSQSRANPKMQYLFLNGRNIRDRALSHALAEAYRGLLLTGRYPIAYLRFDMPPDEVDVNVHPTKLEVRFQDGGRLYSQLLGALRTKFLSTDLTHRLDAAPVADEVRSAHDPQQVEAVRQELVDWAKGELSRGTGDRERQAVENSAPAPVSPADEAWGRAMFGFVPPQTGPLELHLAPRPGTPIGQPPSAAVPPPHSAFNPASRPFDGTPPTAPPTALPAATSEAFAATTPLGQAGPRQAALQIHNRYLVAESDEGVVVIDQHALHERILYEQFRQAVDAQGSLERQRLLVPEPVDLGAAEAAAVLERRELLERLGLQIEPFGGTTVLVSSVPAMFRGANPAEVLLALVERVSSGQAELTPRDLLDELLHTMACKAAIKAGDRLNPDEIAALLEQRRLAHDSHHCPHGRPTELVFTRAELDKQFMRT